MVVPPIDRVYGLYACNISYEHIKVALSHLPTHAACLWLNLVLSPEITQIFSLQSLFTLIRYMDV
jgi:hypothetical protein